MPRRRPTKEELELFDRVLSDATPIPASRKPGRRVIPMLEAMVEPPAPDAPTEAEPPVRRGATGIKTGKKRKGAPSPAGSSGPAGAQARSPTPPPPKPVIAPAHLDEHVHGLAPGVDRRLQLRLKRGQLAIDGRIDLHGMSRDRAHDALNGFLSRSEAMGHRCVLVITGKGQRNFGKSDWDPDAREIGVIRKALPGWLHGYPNSGRVLAFSRAQPKDGGGGAWYVLLRRRRDGSGPNSA
jgi:DNA-nicking Smr family endonuclease